MKTKFLTKLLGLFKDPNIEVRKDALKALLTIIASIDTQTVTLTILPALETVKKAGTDALINALIAKIYKFLGESLQIEILGNKILPSLIPYLSDPSITKAEFSQWKALIFQMIERIERESKQLQDMSSNAAVPTFT